MTSGTVALAASARGRTRNARSRWIELLLVGGATLLLFPASWLVRRAFGLDDSELAVGVVTFYAAYVVNDPHFAVTYILFYRDARRRATSGALPLAQRVRWIVAGVVVPLVLGAWSLGALALRSAEALGWMIQLMFLLVGWHYAKQGFGVLSVLSARRGVRVSPRERVAILVHCYAAWAFAWANPASPSGEYEEKGVVYTAVAHPRWLELVAAGLLASSTAALVWTLATARRREGRALPAAPLAAFLITVWSWTIFSAIDPLVRYLIPALHSAQYLYFVWLMRRNEALASEGPPAFGRPAAVQLARLALSALVLGFVLFRAAPTFLDGAFVPHGPNAMVGALGETPWFAAFYVFVNIHHYFMDHVVWRRENPDTRHLLA